MPISPAIYRVLFMGLLLTTGMSVSAQRFDLRMVNDSLSFLELHTDSTTDAWKLAFPVYNWCTGDVDGDGSEDALVGVVKSTRYDPRSARRLFLFKNYHGYIRPLWMGSRLGGTLVDFRFVNGRVRTLQTDADGQYAVLQHKWRSFGLGADGFLYRGDSLDEARKALLAD